MANFWEKDSLVETPAEDSKNAFWAKDALVEAAPQATTTNPLKGALSRGADLLASGIEAIQRSTQELGKKMEGSLTEEQKTGLESVQSKFPSVVKPGDEKKIFGTMEDWTKSLRDYSKSIGYQPTTKLGDIGDNPLNVVPFVAERIISSSPDMAAVVASAPAYVYARTDEILNERLKNDKKDLKDATVGDLTTALGAAIVESTLEKFATKGLLKPTGGATAGVRIGKEGAIQTSTEAIEEGVSYLGGTAGTKKGVDYKELGQSMLEGALVGGGLGTGVQAGKELVGAPKTTETKETKDISNAVVDETGQIVDKDVLAKREAAAAAQAQQEAGVTQAAAPLTGQGELFTQEQAPFQVTPSERVAQTQAGQTVTEPIVDAEVKARQEASDAAVAQIEELKKQLATATDRNQVVTIRDQISKLEQQVQYGPGATLDILKQEYDALEQKKLALIDIKQQLTEQRDAATKLTDKEPISQQLNAIEEQGAQIDARQKELLAEGKKASKELPTEEAVAEPELNVANVITEDDFKTMKIGKGNKKLREVILGKSLANPEEKQQVIDALTKYSQGKISSEMATRVGDFIDSISKEAQNVQRADVSGAVAGGSEPSVRVPSIPSVAPAATQAPVTGGVVSPVGPAGGLDVGEGGVRKAGAAPLEQKAAPTKPAIDTSKLTEEDRKSIEGFGTRQKRPSTNWFTKKIEEFKRARERGANRIEALFTKGQVYFSFDKAFSDRLYKHFMQLKAQGDLTMDQVKQAMLRISTSQALHRSNLANQIMEMGGYTYDETTNRWEAVSDEVNMRVFEGIIGQLANRLNVDEVTAMQMMDTAYEANRLNSFYDDLTKAKTEATLAQKKIDALKRNKKRTKVEQKELDTKNALLDKLNKRIEDLEGKVRHKNRAQVRDGMDLYNRHPEIQLGTRVWNTMRGRTLKMMVDSGMLTEEKAEQWMDEAAYVPFFRDLKEERDTSTDTIINRGLKESMTPLRAHMEGSELEVTSPIGNMHKWMQWAIASSISNKQQQVMIDQYAAAIPEEVREGKGPESNTFGIYRDGVQRFYHVADPLIAQGFSHMAPMVFPGISAFRGASNMLRHSVTRIPAFPISQIFMDAYAVMFTSGLRSPFKTLLEITKETGRTFAGTSETREKLIRKGILETHDYAALNEADAIGERLGFEKPGMWRRTARALDKFASLADNVVRQGVYNQAIKEGQSDLEASERATEIVNFRRMSGMPAIQAASQIIPFYNAYNQVLSVTLRTVSGKGIVPQERSSGLKTLASTSAKIGMISFLYAMMMGDDEDYNKKNKETRDRLWMIPGTGMGIPIRMDFFAIPKVVGEYTYNLLADKGFSDARHLKNALKRAVIGSLAPPSEGIPQLIRPGLEVAVNYDIFQDRNIVNPTMKRLDPDQRFTKSTSEWAKVMGKLTNISPVNLDHLARGYFGSVATLVSLATDTMIAEMRGIPRPERSMREILARVPSLGAAVGKDENTAVQSDFYEVAREADQIINTTKNIARSNPEEARKYLEKNREKVTYTQGIGNALEGLKRKENVILNSPSMSAETKAAEIKKIDAQRNRLMTPVEKVREKVNK